MKKDPLIYHQISFTGSSILYGLFWPRWFHPLLLALTAAAAADLMHHNSVSNDRLIPPLNLPCAADRVEIIEMIKTTDM